MKFVFTILFSIAACSFCKGQYFNRSYEINPDLLASFNIEQLANDSFLFFSANTFAGNHLAISPVLINQSGLMLNSKLYYDSTAWQFIGWSNSTNKTSDGGYILGGGYKASTDFGHLIKFNRLGDTLWTKKYGDSINYFALRQAKETTDGGIIAVGNYAAVGQRSDGWVVKTDSVGNLQWQRFYTQTIGTLERFFSIEQTTDGGYIVGGYIQQFPNQTTRNYDPLLYKLDSAGNVQWIYTYDTPNNNAPAYAIQTLDGNYVFSSGISDVNTGSGRSKVALFKVDQSGNLMWSKIYGNRDYDTDLLVVKELADSTLIAAGRQGNGIKIEGILVYTQANGDSIFVTTYENDPNGLGSDNILWDVIPLSQGGFMACGEVIGTPPHVNFRQDAWVIRVDSAGCIISNCLVGISEEKEEVEDLILYPNPTQGEVMIDTQLKLQSIEVYNLQGQKVAQISGHTLSLELPQASGIYLLRIRTKDGLLLDRKVVRE